MHFEVLFPIIACAYCSISYSGSTTGCEEIKKISIEIKRM